MKTTEVIVRRYDADEGKVFDWLNLDRHQSVDEEGNTVQEHLYAKTIYLAADDTILNYVEVEVE